MAIGDFFGLKVPIVADDKTAKGINSAKKNVSGFEGKLKDLGKSLAAAFAVERVVAFGKAAAEAFIQDQKEAARLATAVKNLGMEFANPIIAKYIDDLSKAAGVADGELRPALQTLLTQTQNLAKSQELLSLAIEVSRGSGESLATVSQDLANAYVGNTKGLKKYNLGLSQAELKTMSFTDVQKKLTAQFKGSNAAYLKTYAGKMETLTIAAGEAQETIGKGLVDSLALIAGDGSVQSLADAMQSLAEFTSDAIYGLGSLINQLKNVGAATPSWLKTLFSEAGINAISALPGGQLIKPLQSIASYGEKQRNKTLENPSVQMFMTDMANMRLNREKFETDRKLLDMEKKKLAEARRAAMAKKQNALFDMDIIQRMAALQGKITEEEKLRLNLQLALLTGNEEKAKKLSAELADSIDSTGKLKLWLTTLPDANNPFKGWDAWLDNFTKKMAVLNTFTAPAVGTGSNARGADFMNLTPTVQDLVSGAGGRAGLTSGGDVYVSVGGSVVSNEDLISAVENGLQLRSLSGSPAVIGRISGMFG